MKKTGIAAGVLAVTAALAVGCGVSGHAPAEKAAAEAGGGAEAHEGAKGGNGAGAEAESSAWIVSLSQAPEAETGEETVYAAGTNVNVRQRPDAASPSLGKLKRGEALRRIENGGSWSRVIYQGREGYVASRYLSEEEPSGKSGASAGNGADAAVDGGGEENRSWVGLDESWLYASFAKITGGKAALYRSSAGERKGKTVCVNAGHGTQGGASVKTQCHPDGTPKVTGGTTASGAVSAAAVSGGMTFSDGTPEAKVTLAMARILRDKLLDRGYDVLMVRDGDDVQLDNIARTVMANNLADCHIALHWDSTASGKGAFYMSVPDVASYRSMEPVASHWQQHHALGDSLVAGLKAAGVPIFSNGTMAMDLTQTSYSTIPSVDIELGDKASDHSAAALETLSQGLADGVDRFFLP